MRTLAVLSVIFAAACGGDSDNKPVDAASVPNIDAPGTGIDAPPGSTLTVSGVATEQGFSAPKPLAGVVISAYANGDDATVVATTTSAANGSYSLTLPAGMLNGYLVGTKDDYTTTYLYPPAQLTADFTGASIIVLPTTIFNILNANDGSSKGLVALIAVDSIASLQPIEGVAVTSDPLPSAVGYTPNSGSIPDKNGTATKADGRAFLFGLTPGSVTVAGTKTGITLKPTTLDVRANVFTTTLITQ
jgi:hypothetical protein